VRESSIANTIKRDISLSSQKIPYDEKRVPRTPIISAFHALLFYRRDGIL